MAKVQPEVALKTYETVYILKSNLSDSDATTIHQKVDSVIGKFKGTVVNRDDWGQRELAYMIGKDRGGRFCVVNYTGLGGVVEEIERHFRILDGVIRFITIATDKAYEYAKVKKQIHDAEEEYKKAREFKEQRRSSRGGFESGGGYGKGQ